MLLSAIWVVVCLFALADASKPTANSWLTIWDLFDPIIVVAVFLVVLIAPIILLYWALALISRRNQ